MSLPHFALNEKAVLIHLGVSFFFFFLLLLLLLPLLLFHLLFPSSFFLKYDVLLRYRHGQAQHNPNAERMKDEGTPNNKPRLPTCNLVPKVFKCYSLNVFVLFVFFCSSFA